MFFLHVYFLLCTVPPSKSNCWKYFTQSSKGVKCNLCQQIIKTSGNTTNLRFHLIRIIHPKLQFEKKHKKTDLDTSGSEPREANTESSTSKQRNMVINMYI